MEQIENFKFDIPTRIEFGNQKFQKIGEFSQGIGKKAFVISYKDKSLHAFVEECVFLLKEQNILAYLFEEVEANPTHDLINQGVRTARENGCDFVIGLGGGSAIDTAKAISVAAVENVDIWEIVEGKELIKDPLPLIAIPTTSGTGSEVTQYAVISNRTLKRKEGFGKKEFYPKLSILDPLLTVGMPAGITAATGLDALTHAIEAYTTRFANPLSDALAEKAIQLVANNLRTAVYFGKNIQARYNMMLASMLAGMAITHADTSLAHVIGEAIGAVFNTNHGLTVTLALPAVMEYNCFTNIEKFANVAALMGESTANLSTREAAMLAPSAVRKLIRDVNAPCNLTDLGVTEDERVLDLCSRPGWDAANIRPAKKIDFQTLIRGSMTQELSYWKTQSK